MSLKKPISELKIMPRRTFVSSEGVKLRNCKTCKKDKELDFFSRYKRKSKNGSINIIFEVSCKECETQKRKENKVRLRRLRNAARRKRNAEKLSLMELAKANPCLDCGNKFPSVCMDLDHRPGCLKVACVSEMVHMSYSLEEVKNEILKCDAVCACCHRLRTHNRRIMIDLRYIAVKNRLAELTPEERKRLRDNIGRVCLDTFNYDESQNTFCPLAVATGLHETLANPTDAKVWDELSKRFWPVNILKGIPGSFFRDPHRKEDLLYLLDHWVD